MHKYPMEYYNVYKCFICGKESVLIGDGNVCPECKGHVSFMRRATSEEIRAYWRERTGKSNNCSTPRS